jgi:cytochrome c oxidase cbb3-type subunit 3
MARWLTLTVFVCAAAVGQTPPKYDPAVVTAGKSKFLQDCGFCHGRDAGGGEDGPDLTRSKLVAADVNGDKIGPVVRNGRPQTGMPRFTVSDAELAQLVAFIHTQKTIAESQKGGRKGVDVSDLQTGNAEMGKQYFNGAGGCTKCHSASGDLAGLAKRLEGLKLEEQLMYPKGTKSKAVVTLASGEKVAGTVEYKDEFTIAVKDSTGWYRSFPTSKVKFELDSPADAHVDLMAKYTDDDIHNLMAYLQTLK